MMASAFFAAASVSSVSGLLCASIEHCVGQPGRGASSRATYTTEEVLLEVERDVAVLLDDLEHLSSVSACSLSPACTPHTLMPSAMTWRYVSSMSGKRSASCYLGSDAVTCTGLAAFAGSQSTARTYHQVLQC